MTTAQDEKVETFAIPGYESEEKFMSEVRERFSLCEAFYGTKYRRAAEAMAFAFMPDRQWDDWMTRMRRGRPMYTFNKIRQAIKQVTNDQRQNRPQPKVRGANEQGRARAEVHEGIFRGIERLSNADVAYDTSFKYSVGGGYGVWRIDTDYIDSMSFDQDILIREVPNPYAVMFDPSAKEKDRRDGQFLFFKDKMSRKEYARRWPNKEITDFDGLACKHEWANENEVVVCQYWFKVKKKKTIVRLSDGRTVDLKDVELILDELAEKGVTEQARREVEYDQVRHCILSGAHILEKPGDWAGKFIPFVPVWGDLINLDGEDHFYGMTHFSMDAQRLYNYERSTFVETIAEQPKSPFMATPQQVEGFEAEWESIGSTNKPVIFYNHDPNVPGGRPMREPPPAFPAALANAAQISSDDIKATSGKFDASLGQRSNETSGRAIIARQREGDVSSFDYIDNLAFAQKYSYEIIDDLIPHVYDTPRQLTMVDAEDKEKVIEVNQPTFDTESGQWIEANDFEGARYTIGVTVGPSFTTQRLETADAMMQLSNDPSPIGMMAKYQFLKSLDAPGMDELMKGARKFMVSQGLLEPAEGEQAAPQGPPPPNPKDVADAMEKQSQAHLNTVKAAEIEQNMHREVAMDQLAIHAAGGPAPPGMPVPMQMPTQGPPQTAEPVTLGDPMADLGAPVAIPGGIAQDSPAAPAPGGFPG